MSRGGELLERAFADFSKTSETLISYYSLLEERIENLKKEFQFILDSLPVGVALFDKGEITFSNNYLTKIHEKDLLLKGILEKKEREGEYRNEKACYRWKIKELGNGFEGKKILVFEDVTEIEKAKERSELEKRLLAMGEMALRIAHEIKNPLGSMELFLSMLVKGRKRKKYIEYILFGIRTIERIINNILSYTRPKSLNLREANLLELVKETVGFMSFSSKREDIKIDVECSCDGFCLFDPDLVRLVLMNLISNAKEAIRGKGRIKIGLSEKEGYLVLTVSDNGVGIDEHIKKDIFNPFFTTKEKGLGLGLFIVYNIVKAHGGYVEVSSKKGEGSTFFIYLPKKEHGERDVQDSRCG